MIKKTICTKKDLIELRKHPDSFFHTNYLVKDVFGIICEYAFYQKVFKWDEIDLSKITFGPKKIYSGDLYGLYHDKKPLLIKLPEISTGYEGIRNTEQTCQIRVDLPQSLQQTFNGIFEEIHRSIYQHMSEININKTPIKIYRTEIKDQEAETYKTKRRISIPETNKTVTKTEVVKWISENPKGNKTKGKYSHLQPNYDFKNLQYNKSKKKKMNLP